MEELQAPVRAAAYCRVSTDHRDQHSSLVSQRQYFQEYITRHPGWLLTEIFVDEGITGTSTRRRSGFLRMLEAAERNEFDLLLTKEISRFSRNTLDSIYYTRRLKELGIGVVFLSDGINTLDCDGELRLTLLASIAQEESRKTSQRVKWGQQRRMEQGVVFGRSPLGYQVSRGRLLQKPDEAALVARIFRLFAEQNRSARSIARTLTQEGILSPGGGAWSAAAVLRIVRNEKYAGHLIQKKSCTPDYLTHQRRRNLGQEPQITVLDHHAPLVPAGLFQAAQRRLERPAADPLAGCLYCGLCGSRCVLRKKRLADGTFHRFWRCGLAVRKGRTSCPASQVAEARLTGWLSHQGLTPDTAGRILVFSPDDIRVMPDRGTGKGPEPIFR